MITRSHVSKITKIILLAALAAVIFISAYLAVPSEKKGGIKFAGDPESRTVSINVSAAEWDKQTYRNASDFESLIFDGEDAFYYENALTKDEQYSMDASITSPKLDVFPTDYVAEIKYFTRQKTAVPNRISAYVSEDGKNFVLSDYVDVSDSGTEQEVWRKATLSLKGEVSFVRFVFTVYYSQGIAEGGIYFGKNFTLSATSLSDYSGAEFALKFAENVNYDEKTDTVRTDYCGEARYPEFAVTSETTLGFYHKVYAAYESEPSVAVEPIEVGTYRLFVDVYDDCNEKVASFNKAWQIWPKSVTAKGGFALYNDDCIAFYGVGFVSDEGETFTASEVGTKTIYGKKTDLTAPSDVVFLSKNFSIGGFGEDNPIESYPAEDGILYEVSDGVFEYDYTEKTADDLVKAFKTLDESGSPVEITSDFTVSYYKNGTELQEEEYPIDAGDYVYAVGKGEHTPTGIITVKPKKITEVIYEGTESFDKVYDGTKAIALGGKFVDTLEGLSFYAPNGEKLTVTASGAEYGREKGKTYVLVSIKNELASNYVFDEKTYVSGIAAEIAPSTLVLRSFNVGKGGEITFENRQYDGTDDVTVNAGEGAELDVIGAAGDVITLRDVSAKADGRHSGEREVTLTIANETFFDRFAPIIKTEKTPKITIYPKSVQATVSETENESKIYDGTTAAAPSIKSLTINEEETELTEAMKNGYFVDYESAVYDTAVAGTEKTITITNARLYGTDPESETVFSDYVIDSMTVNGVIEPKPIEVFTKQIRVYRGESLPDPEITETKTGILSMKAYATRADAEEGDATKALPARITAVGEYFVRIECSDGNYALDPVIVPLFVVNSEDKAEQFIVFDDFNANVTTSITVPTGSEFSLGARSVTADGTRTGVKLSYEIKNGSAVAEETSDGVFRSSAAGEFIIVVKASGNSYYNDAESVEIAVSAKRINLTATVSGAEFVAGNPLPIAEIEDFVTFIYDGKAVKGSFRPADESKILSGGTNSYAYFFTAQNGYLEKTINYSIYEVLYEKTADGYVKTNDAKYAKNKEYYRVSETKVAVSEGEDLPQNCYEKTENGYVVCSDGIAAADKEYFTLETSETNAIRVNSDGYYTKNADGYEPVAIGEYLDETEKYYVCGKEFYGEKEVGISLTAIKAGVTLSLGNVVTARYSEKVDFVGLIKQIKISGTDIVLPIAELREFDGKVGLVKVTVSGENVTRESVSETNLLPGVYEIYASGTAYVEDGVYYEIEADDENFGYEIAFEGKAELKIVKSKVRIVAPIREKYYFTETETDDGILANTVIDGVIADGDEELIRNELAIRSYVSKRTTVGAYAVEPYVKEASRLEEKYEFEFVQGYVEVIPAEIIVYAVSNGQIYGAEEQGEITIAVTFGSHASEYSREDLEEITALIKAAAEASVDVDKTTDAGVYMINVTYKGDSKNFTIEFGDSPYTVYPDSFEGFSFSDKRVLYDGERHTVEVAYDKERWQNVTIEYDKDYFVEKGTYVYKATISAKNYKTLELSATLTIGTLTVESSNFTGNVVSVTLDENDCPYGVLPELYTVYGAASDEKKTSLKERLERQNEGKQYEIITAFDVSLYLDGAVYDAEYPTYTITLKTEEFKYSDDVKLFGYGSDGYGELTYTYENGVYKVKVTNLSDLVFAREKEVKTSPIVIGVFIAIFVVIILIALGIVFGGGKRARKDRMRSRRRHHRWA